MSIIIFLSEMFSYHEERAGKILQFQSNFLLGEALQCSQKGAVQEQGGEKLQLEPAENITHTHY